MAGAGELTSTRGSLAGSLPRGLPRHLGDRPLPSRNHRPSYLQAGGTDTTGQLQNHLIQHPPLYYLIMGGVLSLVPDWQHLPFDRVLLLLRIANALLCVAVPLLLWATARWFGLPDPLPAAATLIPLAIPELMHGDSSVSNDNLLIVFFLALTALSARVLAGDTSRRTGLAIGLLTSLALLTKGFALVVPVWIGLVYLAAGLRRIRPAAVALSIAWAAALPGLVWWLRNKLDYGVLQPNGLLTEQSGFPPGHHSFTADAWRFLRITLGRLDISSFVYLYSSGTVHGLAALAGVLVLIGVGYGLVRGPARYQLLLLLTPALGTGAVVLRGAWQYYSAHDVITAVQGRYLYGGLAGLGVAALAGLSRCGPRVRWLAPLGVLGFATVFQACYVRYFLRVSWSPTGSRSGSTTAAFAAMADRYAAPTPFLIVIVVGAAALALLALIVLARPPGRSPAPLPPSAADATRVVR